MLETLITSKTRIKLLLKFFLNSENYSYLRGLEGEFHEGSNAIRMELNRFQKAGLLETKAQGNKKMFKANKSHPLFSDLHSLMKKYVGLDIVIDNIAKKAGEISSVHVTGRIAQGLDAQIVELILVGEKIDKIFVMKLVNKVEEMISKKITFVVFDKNKFVEFEKNTSNNLFLLWNKN